MQIARLVRVLVYAVFLGLLALPNGALAAKPTKSGFTEAYNAAAPVTCGVAIEVPL